MIGLLIIKKYMQSWDASNVYGSRDLQMQIFVYRYHIYTDTVFYAHYLKCIISTGKIISFQ